MPRMPKWLGDTVETVFSGQLSHVKVTLAEEILPQLKKVRFEGELKKAKGFVPGNVVEFRVNDTDYRHYTPSYMNAEEGVCEILFYLHDKGPGSKWATSLKVGDDVKLIGPGGKIKYNPSTSSQVVFGDETSLSQFYCLNTAFKEDHKTVYFIYESDENHSEWSQAIGLMDVITVKKSLEQPAIHSVEVIENISAEAWEKWQSASFYLTGRAKSIQAVRKALVARGVAFKQIQTEPYWSEGKVGL